MHPVSAEDINKIDKVARSRITSPRVLQKVLKEDRGDDSVSIGTSETGRLISIPSSLRSYFSTSTPRQKATYPLILRAAGLGSG